ncbi:arabinose transporter [Vibrio tritonius]|uniref:Arabinose transporter n=1 Tax=Vibrio tritonius TaxID=1435069 RepID=A0ABS7YQS1_9VIBR|nr:arabinose transporter [Vibrio tritonius]MCA2018033.1 arabinose transporter [Vibrio tritonius]
MSKLNQKISASIGKNGVGTAIPVMAVVFIAFLVIGMALPVLPLYVHDELNFGPTIIGIVAGGQFLASLLSRLWAGGLSDNKGPRYSVILGIIFATTGGLLYLLSAASASTPLLSIIILLIGRTILGGAESLIITGGMLWALKLVGPTFTGKVISWVGMSMFAAMAIGAPIGSYVYQQWTFLGVSYLSVTLTIISLFFAFKASNVSTQSKSHAQPEPFLSIVKAVSVPGVSFALSGITYGAVTSFLVLYFSLQGWSHGAYAFTAFAVSLIITRIFLGHLPDHLGGIKVTLYSLTIQTIGLSFLILANSEMLAIFGSVLSGVGFSLVFPSLGSVVVQKVPEHSRGIAMGTYNAFLDLTLGIGSPLLGVLADQLNVISVFTASAVASFIAIPVILIFEYKR